MVNVSDSVIAVISGAFPNTLEKTLKALRSVSTGLGPVPEEWTHFFPHPSNITIIGAPEHRAVQNQFPTASWSFLNSRIEAQSTVSQILQSLIGSGKRILVLTFNTDIFNLTKATWPGLQVEGRHFFDDRRKMLSLTSAPVTFLPGGGEPPWMFGHLSTLDEALNTLTQVLTNKGAVCADKPLRQTKLRPLMAQANSAKFFGNAASTNSSGMMGTLLHIAGMRGLVELAGDSGDYLVWLKHDVVSSRTLQIESTAKDPVKAEPFALETLGESTSVHKPEIAPSSKERRCRYPEKYRSDLYSDNIRLAKMGPFPVARLEIYQALDELVISNPRLSLSSLVETAIQIAKKKLPEVQPWDAIRHVTQNQLLKAQVALDEKSKPLRDRWNSGSLIVHSLAKNWKDRATGEILLALFESCDVTGDDIVNVCRSVWGSSGSEALTELYRVMNYLTDVVSVVVEEDKSGIFRVKRQQADGAASPLSPRTERIASEQEETMGADESIKLVQ